MGNTIKVEVSTRKTQPETTGKALEKSGKADKTDKGKAGGKQENDTGGLSFCWMLG